MIIAMEVMPNVTNRVMSRDHDKQQAQYSFSMGLHIIFFITKINEIMKPVTV